MEKKKKTGYKILLTSLTIAAILSNVSMQEVNAAEEYSSSEEFLELEEEVEPTEQEEVEPTEQEEVGPTEQEAIEHEIAEIQSQEAKDTASDDLFLTLETYSLANDEIYDNETLQPYRSITILHNGFYNIWIFIRVKKQLMNLL